MPGTFQSRIEALSSRLIGLDNWRDLLAPLGERPWWFFLLLQNVVTLAADGDIVYITTVVDQAQGGRIVAFTEHRVIDVTFAFKNGNAHGIDARAWSRRDLRGIEIVQLNYESPYAPIPRNTIFGLDYGQAEQLWIPQGDTALNDDPTPFLASLAKDLD